MGILKNIENLYNNIKSSKENANIVYEQIQDLLNEYERDIEEIRDFEKESGYEHFRTKEVQEKVIELIERDESVLRIMDSYQKNIGMQAVYLGLEKIVLRALDDKEASLQQNSWKRNTGMLAANNGLEKATLKALDNKEASIQQADTGENIGIFAALSGLENCVIKALDNKTASLQAQNGGLTMGMISAMRGLKNATLKAIENKECLTQQEKGTEWNIGMYAATYGMEDVVLQILDNKEASLQVSSRNKNLGMYCAENGLVKATAKALILYDETEKQIDSNGETIWTGCYITGKFRNDVLAEISNIKNKSNGNKHSYDDNNTNIKTFEECDNNTICDSEMEGGL